MTRPTIRLELNFGAAPYAPGGLVWDEGNWDVGVWDSSPAAPLVWDSPTQGTWDNFTWAGDTLGKGFWTDISTFAESISIRSGRKRSLESFSAARLTAVLDNSDRRFDPTNLDGPYVVGTNTAIVPGRPLRVVAEWAGIEYPLVFVTADAWAIEWQDPAVSTTVVSCTDAFKPLADFDPLEVSPVGAGEDSGARINRILDNAGWSATARDIDVGNSTLQATNLSSNALTELKLVADSELGQLYVAPDGRVTFENRSARTLSVDTQAVFGDAGTTTLIGYPYGMGAYGTGLYGGGSKTTTELPYADLAISYDDEMIRNKANIARVGGTTQTAADGDSIGRYTQGIPATHTRTDLLLESDTEAADYARTIVARYKDNELRFDSLVVEPDDDDALWPVVLGLSFGDRITIRRRPPGGGALIERSCFVEGKDIDLSARGKWRFTFALSDAAAVDGMVWDHPTRGLWDNNTWAF